MYIEAKKNAAKIIVIMENLPFFKYNFDNTFGRTLDDTDKTDQIYRKTSNISRLLIYRKSGK